MKKNSSSQAQQKNIQKMMNPVGMANNTRNIQGVNSQLMNQRHNSQQNQPQTGFSKSASKIPKALVQQYQSPNMMFGMKLPDSQSQQQLPLNSQMLFGAENVNYQAMQQLPTQPKKVQKAASKNAFQSQQKYLGLGANKQTPSMQPSIKSRNYMFQPVDIHSNGSRTQHIAQANKTGGQTQFQTQTQILNNRSNSQQSTKSAMALGKKKNTDYDLTCYNDSVEGGPKQTLYTNISLRELSNSPDREANSKKSKKILISNPRGTSQDSNEELIHRQAQRGENGAILNIKTVQDINIYNNSFIVNTGGQGAFQQQQIQNIIQEQQNTKKGLKLRKELGGLSHGFQQSRSVSQGRATAQKIGSLTDQNAQQYVRAGQTDQAFNAYLHQSSSSSNVINHVMSHHNMQNLAQNPNQKRIISNASGKMFGNLGAITNINKQTSKQVLQNVYHNERQGIKKILSNKLSSNTSRLQSRTDSRGLNQSSLEKAVVLTQSHLLDGVQAESTPNLRNMDPLYQNMDVNKHELRKKSLQDFKKNSNKFRNQTNINSEEDSQMNQSINMKRNPPNRVKTTEVNNEQSQIEVTSVQMCQQWAQMQNSIFKSEMNEGEVKLNLKKLNTFLDQVKNTFQQLLKANMSNLAPEKQLENLQQEITVVISYQMADIGQNHEAIKNLDKICTKQNVISILSKKTDVEKKNLKQALLLKSIIQRKIGEHDKALETISNCITSFPDFENSYLVRGQTYLLMGKSQKAHQDFLKFDQFQSNNEYQSCIAKESLGDALKNMKKYKQAAQCYNEAIQHLLKTNEKSVFIERKIKIKIAMCTYYQGNMADAINLFKQIINYYQGYDKSDIKVQQKIIKCNFYNAKAILSQSNKNEDISYQKALLNLQYCCNDEVDPELHELYCGNATFEIAKIFLKQKDILNAHDFMQRATDNNFNSKRLSLYRDFAEGVVQLMKRKIKKGVQILTDLLEILINGQKEIEKNQRDHSPTKLKDRYNQGEEDMPDTQKSSITGKSNQVASGKFNKDMYNYLIFNIYIYRSYGYVAIEKYEHALQDLAKAKAINPKAIDRASIYNKWLSRGILKMDTEEYLMASKYFGKASLRFSHNKDSFCLNAISIVRSYSYSMADQFIDDLQKQQKVEQTLEFMNVAISCCCKTSLQPSLYFFRGLLNFQLHNFYEAIQDFNVAIKEEEEPTGQFHLARGRAYACLSILDEALKDLSIALELDETLHEAYIFRGKCAYLLGDNNLAFHDFQKLIMSDQKNPIVHIYAGNLLMTTGAYNDAIKAFDNADTVQQTALASFQRIRCFCAISDLEKAFEQMQLCLHLAPNEKFAHYDYKVLLPLLSCVRSFEFAKDEKGQRDPEGLAEQINIIKNSVNQISSIIETFEKEEHLQIKRGQSKMTIQIIPNVQKIKLEKNIYLKNLSKTQKDQPLPDLSKDQKAILKKESHFGYYRENIFQLEEMYLYRSIFNTYLGNYDKAISDLNKSWKQHISTKQLTKKEDSSRQDPNDIFLKQAVSPLSVSSQQSQMTDLSDIGLCSINVREYNYNMLINLIQKKDWEEALKKVNEELTQGPANAEQAKNVKQLYLVRAMIYLEQGLTEKYNSDLTIYLKNFKKIQKNEQNAVVIEPFDSKGRLCKYFQPLEMNFTPSKSKSGFIVWMRPSFSMPFIKPPNMIPNIDEQVIQGEFNLKQIDAPMPEAPWQRYCTKQEFDPFQYLSEMQKEGTQEKKLGRQNQQFTHRFLQKNLVFDEKVVEDIDDLSDTEKVSLISDIEINSSSSPRAGALGLKDMNKINQARVTKVHNGVKIQNGKYKCRSKSCSSCNYDPVNNESKQVSNQDIFIKHLKMTEAERRLLGGLDPLSSDTISEQEYGSSSSEQEGEKKPSYSHSRFSSNMGDLEEQLEHIITPEGEIDQANLQVNGPDEKKLINDKRKLQKKPAGAEPQADPDFIGKIESIQQVDSPMKVGGEERESMVLLGSKNFDKSQPKKKTKKIGGATNLKKNKLAIAFNNLENAGDDED